MSLPRIAERWVRFVLRGEGKSRSDANERFAYRGPVMYSNDWPAARLVKGPGMDWVCVAKLGIPTHNPREWAGDGKPRVAEVLFGNPCVGVYSKFEGDMISDEELHERTKWLAHREAQFIIEQALTWPADKVLLPGRWGKPGSKQLLGDLRRACERYDKHSEAFELGWPEWPSHYATDLEDAIASRAKDYHDPKAVAQRERQKARREAKVAFGLE